MRTLGWLNGMTVSADQINALEQYASSARIKFAIVAATNVALSAGWTTITFAQEVADSDNWVTVPTQYVRVPEHGIYLVTLQVYFSAPPTYWFGRIHVAGNVRAITGGDSSYAYWRPATFMSQLTPNTDVSASVYVATNTTLSLCQLEVIRVK